MKSKFLLFFASAVVATTLLGCGSGSNDVELAALAMDAADRQAEQNRQMAELQDHVARGAEELVAADAEARKEMSSLSRELQTERSEIGRQRDELESERKAIAKQRHRDPLISAAITHAAWILACLLPLVVCVYLLRRPAGVEEDGLVAQVLIEDALAERPLLFSRSEAPRALPRAETSSPAALADSSNPDNDV